MSRELPAPNTAISAADETNIAQPTEPLTLLLVEDEPRLQEGFAKIFSCFNLYIAGSGHQAIALLREQAVDAVLTDWKMPDGDGIALVRWLSVHRPELMGRLLVMTGAFLDDMPPDGIPVIQKPFRAREAIQRIRQLCASPGRGVSEGAASS